MIISELKINNYRNLFGLHVINDEPCKFIIGENGIGKSNIIEMLNTLFNRYNFQESDFNNVDEPIVIEITIRLSVIELGYFDDLFDVDDPFNISIVGFQDKPNERLDFKHKSSDSRINYKKINDIPFVYYCSTEAPKSLDFRKSKTAGKFLNEIVNDFVLEKNINSNDLLKEEKIGLVTDYVNSVLSHMKFIEKNELSAKLEDDILSLLPRLIELKDTNNISINDMGSGVRYSSYIYFEILNKILQAVKQDSKAIIQNNYSERYLPIIVALDEPEIHLHPFMQRNLIADIKKIISNKDENFNKLIKELFGIDYLIGELIVATHSSNIISGNYKEYIRLYEDEGSINNKSGTLVNLGVDEEKHLLSHSYTIKETFFARVALIVEGDTELGALPVFADKLGYNLDSYSISIISVRGVKSVPAMRALLEYFGIQSICIVDRDVAETHPERYDDMFLTEGLEFEEDIIDTLLENDAYNEIKDIIINLAEDGLNTNVQRSKLDKLNYKYKLIDMIDKDYRLNELFDMEDKNMKKLILISWLSTIKNIAEGRILGKCISTENIPQLYRDVITKAKEVSENV